MKIDDIQKVAVVGAGDMGHGIAEVALIAGYQVFLQDISQELVDRGVSRILTSLEKLADKGIVGREQLDTIRSGQLVPCVELEKAVREVDLVIEAIPEVLDLKKKTFQAVDKAAPLHALFASNTSTMSITEIASMTARPEQFIGLHYFNPVVMMKLVEVIRGEKTSEDSIQTGYDFVLKIGKVPVRVNKDVPGFIVNRVQAPGGVLLNCILDKGIASPESVDAAFRNAGVPMGPYEVIDFTGIDINYHASAYFATTLHPDYAMGAVLTAKFKAGDLGKKTGKGIFDWSKGRPEIDLSAAAGNFDPLDFAIVNANEAAKIVEMGVCSFADVDVAIKNATGNRAGLIALVQSISSKELSERLDGLAERFDKEIFRPATLIKSGAYQNG